MTSGIKRTTEEIREIVENIGYYFLEDYQYNNFRRVIIQDSYGYKYDVVLNSLIGGYVPEIVRHTNPFSLDNISLWLKLNNKNFELSSENKYINNSKKLFFYCYNCKDIFHSRWNQILRGDGCGLCSGNQVGKYNNLEYLRPELAEEWGLDNFLRPTDVTLNSGKKITWVCKKCGHKWQSRVANRSGGKGCPACVGQVLTDKNRLSILFPTLTLEWHPTLNGKLSPYDVSYGSSKKVWWLCCRCETEWIAPINNRTNVGSGCPSCSNSKKESSIATELKAYILNKYDSKDEYQILKNSETDCFLPYDIYIFEGENPEINGVYIEIHWEQHYKITHWHRQIAMKNGTTAKEEFEYQKHKDGLKRRFARKHGVYIEIDLRKIKTIEQAIGYVEDILEKHHFS